MKIVLIAPPRMYWPYISSGDNFLCPQNLVCLAAVLAKEKYDVEIIDCMPLKMGWKSLAQELLKRKPDVVAMGENHALYIDELLKGFSLVKKILPGVITIGGGAHLTNLHQEYILNNDIDFIVMGEGELTFLELIKGVENKTQKYFDIKGIVYKDGEEVKMTDPRPLIEDLDTLPLPAYDLVPMHLYGRNKYLFSPGGATIHHSRGCTNSCNFCVWWTQMAKRKKVEGGKIELKPHWRTKSVPRVMEEIDVLVKKHNKRCLVFVDESWNIDPKFNDAFADELIKSKLNPEWFAFMRADCVLRDEESGILEKLVRSGLRHVLIGVERSEAERLADFDKSIYAKDQSVKAFQIFQKKYPEVFTQGTFIVGVREETKKSMWQQAEFAKKLNIDFPAFHPLTPVPGTKLYDKAKKENWLETTDWRDYNWATPIISSKELKREEIAREVFEMNKYVISPKKIWKGLFSRSKYKRNIYIWWLLVSFRVALDAILRLVNPLRKNVYSLLVKPKWYED